MGQVEQMEVGSYLVKETVKTWLQVVEEGQSRGLLCRLREGWRSRNRVAPEVGRTDNWLGVYLCVSCLNIS